MPFEREFVIEKGLPPAMYEQEPAADDGVTCEFDFAEEAIVMFHVGADWEVGVGESLRPYDQVYKGKSVQEASMLFVETILEHARWIPSKT